MSGLPAGFEGSSDEDFEFGGFKPNAPPAAAANSHPTTTTTKPKYSFMPAGAESSDEDYDDFRSLGGSQTQGASRQPVTRAQERVGMPVENSRPVGRGRGVLGQRGEGGGGGGRGGFGSPSSAQAGRGKKRNPFRTAKDKPLSPQKLTGPSPVALEDFKVAVIKGNVDAVQKYLAHDGIKVDAVLSSGWTALMYAANSAKSEIVDILIKNGANVNFQKDLYTVLMATCDANASVDEEDVVTCVDLLLEHGARTGVYDRHRITPLMYAARQGRVSVCLKLIEKGAQIDKIDVRGWTALSWAASEGHGRLVRVLLDHKADAQMYTNDGQAPYDIAYSKGHDTIASILEEAALGHLGQRTSSVATASAQAGSASMSSHSVSSCDELELFLSGLELGHLVPKFKEHKISFTDLIKMTETDLEQMGVTQVGVRKKILDATHDIHAKEWNMTSLQQQNKALISAPDVTNVLANISKHLAIIHGSVGYVQKQIQAVTDPTQFIHDVGEAEGLGLYAKEASITGDALQQDLTSLRLQIDELSQQTRLVSGDLISAPKDSNAEQSKSSSIRGPLVILGIAGIAIGLMCYKKYAT